MHYWVLIIFYSNRKSESLQLGVHMHVSGLSISLLFSSWLITHGIYWCFYWLTLTCVGWTGRLLRIRLPYLPVIFPLVGIIFLPFHLWFFFSSDPLTFSRYKRSPDISTLPCILLGIFMADALIGSPPSVPCYAGCHSEHWNWNKKTIAGTQDSPWFVLLNQVLSSPWVLDGSLKIKVKVRMWAQWNDWDTSEPGVFRTLVLLKWMLIIWSCMTQFP